MLGVLTGAAHLKTQNIAHGFAIDFIVNLHTMLVRSPDQRGCYSSVCGGLFVTLPET